MTHDEFLRLLARVEPPEAPEAGPTTLEAVLPPAAARHLAGCEGCRRTAEALLSLARDDEALFDEPDEAYWRDFDERLSARLEGERRPDGTASRGAWSSLLRLAAVVVLGVGLAALALRGLEPTATGPVADGASETALADEWLLAWSDEAPWLDEQVSDEWLTRAAEGSEALSPSVPSPVDALHAELAEELDDAQAAELARLLRAEIAS
jgi:hypothetical protein